MERRAEQTQRPTRRRSVVSGWYSENSIQSNLVAQSNKIFRCIQRAIEIYRHYLDIVAIVDILSKKCNWQFVAV